VVPRAEAEVRALLERALGLGKGLVQVHAPSADAGDRRRMPSSPPARLPALRAELSELDPRLFSFNSKHGWCERCYGTGLLLRGFDAEQTRGGDLVDRVVGGAGPHLPGLRGEAAPARGAAVTFSGRSIAEITALPVDVAERFFRSLRLRGRAAEIARDILAELRSRLAFLAQVGLGYLALDRAAPTLAGGEAQRIRLASQLGSNLRGVCYILDEPTIGLTPRQPEASGHLTRLKAKGNTVVVVEHDEETIRRAEHVVDWVPVLASMGSACGGGHGRRSEKNPESVTGRYLVNPCASAVRAPPLGRRAVRPLRCGGRACTTSAG